MAASLAFRSTPWMKERSTLITSIGKLRRCPSDENPVPKSSMAIRTPRSWSSCSSARARRPADDDRRLGDLEPEQARAHVLAGECLAHERAHSACGELFAGEVDPGG